MTPWGLVVVLLCVTVLCCVVLCCVVLCCVVLCCVVLCCVVLCCVVCVFPLGGVYWGFLGSCPLSDSKSSISNSPGRTSALQGSLGWCQRRLFSHTAPAPPPPDFQPRYTAPQTPTNPPRSQARAPGSRFPTDAPLQRGPLYPARQVRFRSRFSGGMLGGAGGL
jgi:hypothetical protein